MLIYQFACNEKPSTFALKRNTVEMDTKQKKNTYTFIIEIHVLIFMI